MRAIEGWLYRNTIDHELEPFEEAKIRLNLRLTWMFFVAGFIYSLSFISERHYFVVGFGGCISLSLLLLPVTIKFGYVRLRHTLYFFIVLFFIIVNIFGSGNGLSIPIVLWMILTMQLTTVILDAGAALIVASAVIVFYFMKWWSVKEGMNFPYWIPQETIVTPRLIDIAAPLFYNLSLTYNSYKLNSWAREQLLSSNERVRKLNAAIADTEWRNNLIVEQSLGFISIHDDKGIITFINNSTSRTLGFNSSELIGKSIKDLLAPETRDMFGKYLERVATIGSAEGIMRVRSRSGAKLFWYYRNVSIPDEGGRMNVLCFAQDITELEITRQQLQKARSEAEESDRLKSLFLANISHEFRTPMNAIIGFSELLENPNITQTRKTIFTRHIRERSLNLLGMLNNLLDFSRLEAGHVSIQPLDGNIDELMDKVVVSIGAETIYINQKDVEIRKTNYLPASMHKARLDYFKLNQVLVNLMSNAMKFTQVGYILLECREVEKDLLQFSVADTGDGIQPEKLETIFKPFRQANDTIQSKYGGSGLGLAICKGLVESWGGKLWVESIPGKGSVFYFTIRWYPPSTP